MGKPGAETTSTTTPPAARAPDASHPVDVLGVTDHALQTERDMLEYERANTRDQVSS